MRRPTGEALGSPPRRTVSRRTNATRAGNERRSGTRLYPASAHIPKDVLAQLKHVALEVFGYRFVAAMRSAIALPALVVLAGAAACTAIRTRKTPAEPEVPVELSA